MAHTLPPRPAFVPDPPAPTISQALEADLAAAAGPSTAPIPSHCAICSAEPKYTCPGCTRRTCSLSCSKAHKEEFACSGQRDTTAFVPLKEVSEGVWADDYRWLEEGRRKIAGWADALPPQALAKANQEKKDAKGIKRKRPVRNGVIGGALGVLAKELERREIGVEFMPEGMEKRRKNQSSFNPQTQTLNLTLQFVLDDDIPVEGSQTIHHRRIPISLSAKEPASLGSLLPDDLDLATLVLALPIHIADHELHEASYTHATRFFPPLQPGQSILEALRGTAFVEFPIIRVFRQDKWDEQTKKGEFLVMPLATTRTAATHDVSRKRKAEDHPSAAARSSPTAARPVAVVMPIPTPLPSRPAVPTSGPPNPLPAKSTAGLLGLGLGNYDSDDSDE